MVRLVFQLVTQTGLVLLSLEGNLSQNSRHAARQLHQAPSPLSARTDPSQADSRFVQMEFVVAFLGVTVARAVAAPLNPNYTKVSD